jgi:hypothetical protein
MKMVCVSAALSTKVRPAALNMSRLRRGPSVDDVSLKKAKAVESLRSCQCEYLLLQ